MRVLITLGRLPKGLELARAFARAGAEVIVAEPFAWHLCRVSRAVRRSVSVPAPNDDATAYLDALARLAVDAAVDLVVPVSDETMHVGALADRLAALPRAPRLYCPPQPALLALHDKLVFIETARQLDLPVPETCAFGGDSDRAPARALLARRPCISKPRFSSAGKGLAQHAAGSDLAQAWPPADAAPAVLQEHLPGDELCTFGIARQGRLVANVVYRGRIMSGTVAVCFERLQAYPPAIDAWARTFAERTGHDGFLSFDFRLDADGIPLPIECNPRATSGIHFLAPETLATAVLASSAEAAAVAVTYRHERRLQMFYPALTEVQAAALRQRPVPRGLRLLFGTRDVTWAPDDPLPLLLQPLVSSQILARCMRHGWTFGEASTVDIAWHH